MKTCEWVEEFFKLLSLRLNNDDISQYYIFHMHMICIKLQSTIMEAEGFRRALAGLLTEGVDVVEVVTDAHSQISAIMSK